MSTAGEPSPARAWWRTAVIYEIYVRSFLDSDGDGLGDVPGIRAGLPYLADLGVDALWISPWYPSPLADGGYDITDYCSIDPRLGTLDDAREMIADAHRRDIRVIVDLVANHTSIDHPLFKAALAAGPGAAERDHYFFRDGRGAGGDEPPNDWISAFGGPAWTRLVEPDGTPGQWYLHLFAPAQPDLNWRHPVVLEMFDDILRFWIDLGVDGFRVDAAPAMAKHPDLPDAGHAPGALFASTDWVDNPHWDVDEVHDILRRWRALLDAAGGEHVFVTEAVVNGADRLARYLRPDEMHTSFNFDYLQAGWDARRLRTVIDESLAAVAPVGAPATWVLSSHDETRHLTRFGRADTSGGPPDPSRQGAGADLALGTRRARAAALLTLGLPGGAYLYQGEELGLPEVTDLPVELLQDPTWERSGHTVRGRDGCRVPLPWSGQDPPFGFTSGEVGWLPQPADWAALTADRQQDDPDSMLTLYRAALALRRADPGWHSETLTWLAAPPDVLAFERGAGLRCVVNLSTASAATLGYGVPLLLSGPVDPGTLPPDTAGWFRT